MGPAHVDTGVWNASDEALVAGLSNGDGDVALVFVRRFQARVYGLALAITRDRASAEEVAQDTFVRAWRYGASYDPRRGPVAAWLLRIARNAALDHVMSTRRRLDRPALDPAVLDPAVLAGVAGGDGDAVSPLHDLAVVADGVRSLPVEQRDTLMAAVYHGFTAREISEAWDVPLGTVKTRLRLALARLRELYAKASL
ncbi:MAG: RNA polymerase sigma factor [Ilumatobacteraceae bacterium]